MKKLLYMIMCLVPGICLAQNDFWHLDIGGGINSMKYETDSRGSVKPGVGITVRGGYRHFFDSFFGVGINVVFKTCATNCTLSFTETIDDAIDSEGEQYEHQVRYKSLKEKQIQYNVSLPVGAYFRHGVAKNLELNVGAGVWVQTTVANNYKIAAGRVETIGYYAEDNVAFDEMPQHDFYDVNDFSGNYKYKPSVGAYGEVGVERGIRDNLSLTVGLYGSYGISNCMDDHSRPVYDYKSMQYVGVLNSEIVKHKIQMAFGILVGLRFGRSGKGSGGGGRSICPAYGN